MRRTRTCSSGQQPRCVAGCAGSGSARTVQTLVVTWQARRVAAVVEQSRVAQAGRARQEPSGWTRRACGVGGTVAAAVVAGLTGG